MVTSGGYYDDELSLEDGVSYLRKMLSEFPFSDWGPEQADGTRNCRSQAVHITAMLSQVAARLIPRESLRLGFIYNSNSHGSGKSLLAKIAIMPTNVRMVSQPWRSKDEELTKVLDAEVLRASRYICFDNVRAHVSSQVLEGFMTSSTWTGRLLGKTQMFEAANAATVFITGNDLSVSPDIKRRTVEVTLFVSEADVQTRIVENPIDDAWLLDAKNRRDILNALSAIIRHWANDGQQLATKNLRIGYERWCQVFSGITQFAGFGDPLAPPGEMEEEQDMDTETADVRNLVLVLADSIISDDGKRIEYTFQQVVNLAHEHELFDWILDGKEVEQHEEAALVRRDYILKTDSKSKFGKLLKRYAPYTGEAQGPRFRVFRVGKGDKARQIRMSSIGRTGRRKFIVEAADKQAE